VLARFIALSHWFLSLTCSEFCHQFLLILYFYQTNCTYKCSSTVLLLIVGQNIITNDPRSFSFYGDRHFNRWCITSADCEKIEAEKNGSSSGSGIYGCHKWAQAGSCFPKFLKLKNIKSIYCVNCVTVYNVTNHRTTTYHVSTVLCQKVFLLITNPAF